MTLLVTWLAHSRRTDARFFFCGRSLVRIGCALALLALAAGARAETEGPNAPNPENVMTRNPIMEHFDRVLQPAAAVTAPRVVERRSKRPRNARTAKPQWPPVTEAPALPVLMDQPFWPNVFAIAAAGETAPGAIQTVRAAQAADAEEDVVFANELSDIDLAAKPLAEPPADAATDGRAGSDPVPLRSEQSRFAPLVEAARGLLDQVWIEPLLMLLAGAFAALSAVRVFA